MAFYSFSGVFGAGRCVSARWRKHRRDCVLIGAKQEQCERSRKFGDFQLRARSLFKFFAMASKALATSFCKSANSASNSVRLGLITTSAATTCGNPFNRTASAQTALHAISLYRSAQRFADGEPHPQAMVCLFGPQIKHGHVLRKVPAAALINLFKICMPQQAAALGKTPGRVLQKRSCSKIELQA